MVKYPLFAILAMLASAALAQVKVVDSKPSVASATMPPPSAANTAQDRSASKQTAELFYQFQTLQQEVQELRGMVEEQAHEIKRLKQQRMDDYLDLDRRLSEMSQAGASAAPQRSSSPTPSAAPASTDELADYRAAIDLVLKQQDYDQGIVALNEYLKTYPKGRYAANAQYWLGQIYLLRNELEQSRQWFSLMLKEHPNDQKAPEAKFKLGKVYDLLGDKQQARDLLEEVAGSSSSAAGLARDYLRENFSS